MSKYVVKVWSDGEKINKSKRRDNDEISRFYLRFGDRYDNAITE